MVSLVLAPLALASGSFRERVFADPAIQALGSDARDIIEGTGGFRTDFTAIASAVEGSGAKLGDVFDVTRPPFLAPTDGTGDAAIGINAAYEAAARNGGGTVVIPPGRYRLLAQLHPRSNTATRATGAVLDRAFHNSEGRNSNVTGSGLVLIEGQANFSWVGGTLTNGGGVYRGRAFEAIESRRFEVGELRIHYQGVHSGQPTGAVGLFFTSCEEFYVHDLVGVAAYLGDETFPDPVGNTCFRFADCRRGVIYRLDGVSYDNILSMTATNEDVFYRQHDLLVADLDARQVDNYGRASAILVGTSGSQPRHRGVHHDIFFIDVTMKSAGNTTSRPQPQFQVINRSNSGAHVRDIHFVGLNSDEPSACALRISQGGENKGIDNVTVKRSTLISHTKFGVEIIGKVGGVDIDTHSRVEGKPAIKRTP